MTRLPGRAVGGRASSPLARRGGNPAGALSGVWLTGAATILCLSVLLASCAPAASDADPTPRTSATAQASPAPTPTVDPVPVPVPVKPIVAPLGEGVEPAAVRIPAIGLDEPLIGLGIKPDGSMYVPAEWNDVGWFTGGGKPGGRGPTIIAGHVDSVSEPAVFFRLAELVPGDTVEVTDVNGAVTTYVVSEVTDFPKAQFPTSRVFGALPTDELRLITCGGFFDPAAASYVDNTVVFATRA